MATTADYLTQLQADKQTLVDNLVAKGVEATSDETFTTLAPKVADIQSGGSSFKITDAKYLFYSNARTDVVNELCALIDENCSIYSYMFSGSSITEAPYFNTSNGSKFDYFMANCSNLVSVQQYDTSNASDCDYMFTRCGNLVSMAQLDFGKCTRLRDILYNATKLTNFGGFKDLGKAYEITSSASNAYYKLDLSKCTLLTHDSLMNVINNLYDIATKGCKPQDLVLGTTNLAKLTEDEIAIATNKGWNVS